MTVQELIKVLKTFDQNMNVYTEVYYEGLNEIQRECIHTDEDGDIIISPWNSNGNR